MKSYICFILLAMSSSASAVEYLNTKITGVGLAHNENFIRFTIEKDPNVVLLTRQVTGEQHARMVSLILAAYAAGAPVAFVRSSESTSSTTRHYSDVLTLEIGAITHD
jgi:predicted methyltransferase MtxX (methanogen marker protein 4)